MASSRVYERGERGNDWTFFFFFLPVNNQKADKKKIIKAKQLRLNKSMSKQRRAKEWNHSFSPEKKN